jgi:hypothetical protein
MLIEENEDLEEKEGVVNDEGGEEEEDGENGDFLMIRRMLGNQAKEEESNQNEILFHTRCLVHGKVCSLIIDGGSCTNVGSAHMVGKLELETRPHLGLTNFNGLVKEYKFLLTNK